MAKNKLGTMREPNGSGGKHSGHKGKDNEVDGRDCVNYDVSDEDFKSAEHYMEGPTDYTGGGSNEKHS